MTSGPRDANRIPSVIAKSSSDNTVVVVEADPVTRRLKVDALTTIDTTGLATSAKQDSLLAELELKANLTETQPVSLASVPSHAVTNAGTFAVQVDALLPSQSDLATLATTHVKKYYTNAGAVTDGIIWSPAAGKRWFVTDIFLGVSANATVTLEDDLAGGDSAVWKMELLANEGWSHHFGTPLFSGEDAADLLVTTTAGNVYITITGYEV